MDRFGIDGPREVGFSPYLPGDFEVMTLVGERPAPTVNAVDFPTTTRYTGPEESRIIADPTVGA